MRKILDLKNDIVFKLFFSKEKNKPFLISFLESVLLPPCPIEDVTLLNPQITKNAVNEKASILDLVIQLKDGTRLDVEMQMATNAHFRKRFLYYWAKLHYSQLETGRGYHKLVPTISIAILNDIEFKYCPTEAHSIFELREKERNELYLPDLQLHFLELPKFEAWTKRSEVKYDPLEKWMRFFKLNESAENYANEISKDPLMSKALKALEELSLDPSAQELADMREKARINWETQLECAFEKGEEQGIEKGIEKGIGKGSIETERRIVSTMLKKGLSISEIADTLDMSIVVVENLSK